MSSVEVKAYAKINISLDVLSKLEDGYHEMLMVMQSVGLCDDIRITLNDTGRFESRSNLSYLPDDGRNLAVRAAKLFLDAAGMPDTGAMIEIQKRIPVCAGLGGGSADAAAVLRALNSHTGAGFSREALEKLGETLGSDVPFCVAGGTAIARGRGEKLKPLPPLPTCHIVICMPDFTISTPALFNSFDCGRTRNRPDTEGLVRAIEGGDLQGAARRMYNVFEDVLPRNRGEVSALKGKLLEYGALGAAMSGTGPAVFGLFGGADKAEAAYYALSGSGVRRFLTKPIEILQ